MRIVRRRRRILIEIRRRNRIGVDLVDADRAGVAREASEV